MFTSSLAAAIVKFRLPVASDIVRSIPIEKPAPENMIVAFGMSLISGLQAEL